MTVFPSRQHPDRLCLLDALSGLAPSQLTQTWPEGFAGGILHRLDVSTSGLIAIAKTRADFDGLRGHFSQGHLNKRYFLLSIPEAHCLKGGPWAVELPLAHHKKNRRKMVWKRGKHTTHRGQWYPAKTGFRALGVKGEIVFIEAQMSTGVMHQIRAHSASQGYALLGDTLYGGAADPGPAPEAHFFLHHVQMQGMPDCPRAPLPQSWHPYLPEGFDDLA